MLLKTLLHRVPLSPQWQALLGGLLLLGLIAGWSRHDAWRQIEQREQERLLSQARVLNFIVGQHLVAADTILAAQAREWAADPDGQAATQRLQALDSALEGMRSLMILDAAGISRASSRRELLGRNFSEREYYRFFKENSGRKALYISPPFRSVLGTVIIVLARPVFDKYGVLSAVVTATLDPDFFVPLLKAVGAGADTRTILAHGEGRLFLMEPERAGTALYNMNTPGSVFRAHMDGGNEASVLKGALGGAWGQGHWAIATVSPSDVEVNQALVVLAGRSLDSVSLTWKRDSILLGAGYLLFGITSCLMLHVYMIRKKSLDQQLQDSAHALEAKARFIRSVTDGVPGMIGYWNEDLRCQFANQAYLEWFGKSPEQLIGINMRDLLGEELFRLNEPHIFAALWGEPQTFERALTKADGSIGYTLARYIPDRHGGKVQGFFVLITDVTELKQTQAKMESLIEELNARATLDELTGLANRRWFWDQAKMEITRSRRYGLPLCLIMLDIDKFKSINDGFGHAAGDAVLRSMASVMNTALRETDIVGRLGGEEFGILLPQTGEPEAELIAERLRQAVMATSVVYEDRTIRFTISLGLASAWKTENSVDELVKRADVALYHAKETGRNRVWVARETV